MITFDGVGCVDQPSNLFWELKKGCQLLPIVLPGFNRSAIFAAPFVFQLEQVGLSLFAGGRLIDGFEI